MADNESPYTAQEITDIEFLQWQLQQALVGIEAKVVGCALMMLLAEIAARFADSFEGEIISIAF